jgi:hypothetical protein
VLVWREEGLRLVGREHQEEEPLEVERVLENEDGKRKLKNGILLAALV